MQHQSYILTFEDGSKAYLEHYGVKGMKWGVWNEETRSRYSVGPGHRSIMRANKKVDKISQEHDSNLQKYGKKSYQALSSSKKLDEAVEKREFRVEKNRPGEGKLSPDRYNEMRSNERFKRAAIIGGVVGGPWGAAIGSVAATSAANLGKRTVGDLLRGRETYRINPKTGQYENTSPYTTESSIYNEIDQTINMPYAKEPPYELQTNLRRWFRSAPSLDAHRSGSREAQVRVPGSTQVPADGPWPRPLGYPLLQLRSAEGREEAGDRHLEADAGAAHGWRQRRRVQLLQEVLREEQLLGKSKWTMISTEKFRERERERERFQMQRQSYILTFEDGSEAYLAHYGVMGMKWGIRHDPQKTGQKVATQVAKHQAKADKYRAKANKKDSTALGGSKSAKYAKYMAKAHKYTKKANRSNWHPLQSSHRRAVNQRKAEKYQKKAAGYANSVAKIEKYNAKANKYQYKADRLQNAYTKQLRKIERKNAKKGKAAMASVM